MQENDFITASANVSQLDDEALGMPIVTERKDGVKLDRVMSNSFGFGGTNASLVFQRYAD
jgi:3-oxoacyl-[acyl-carrier-protein] synthase-1